MYNSKTLIFLTNLSPAMTLSNRGAGGYKEMSSILLTKFPRIWAQSREEGGELPGLSQWVQLYTGAQINFGDLTPYLTNDSRKQINKTAINDICYYWTREKMESKNPINICLAWREECYRGQEASQRLRSWALNATHLTGTQLLHIFPFFKDVNM